MRGSVVHPTRYPCWYLFWNKPILFRTKSISLIALALKMVPRANRINSSCFFIRCHLVGLSNPLDVKSNLQLSFEHQCLWCWKGWLLMQGCPQSSGLQLQTICNPHSYVWVETVLKQCSVPWHSVFSKMQTGYLGLRDEPNWLLMIWFLRYYNRSAMLQHRW